MEKPQELQLPVRESQEPNSVTNEVSTVDDALVTSPPLPKHSHYKWWLLVSLYTVLVLVGQSGATLLGKFYFNNGGNSKWIATFVQSGGFPFLLPLLLLSSSSTMTPNPVGNTKPIPPSFTKLALIYASFGLVACGTNLMYSYGSLYLPVSTYSLLCATQLAFNAVFSYFLNSLKLTQYVLNSLVLVTISALILGIQRDPSTDSSTIPKGHHAVGFLCTVGASALYSLQLSLSQLFIEKIRKKETFSVIFEMVICVTMVATFVSVVGLFFSGEWRELKGDMDTFRTGRVSYIMTLGWTAVLWQVFAVSSLGLIYEASSLFSNVISTVCLPVVPICAVILFHDRMDGMKVIAMLLAIWGFFSYVYEHYIDYSNANRTRRNG